MNDPMDPEVGRPHRNVEPWTQVMGHQVVTAVGRPAFCSCGERQRDERHRDEWRVDHLANAWPVLLPRLADESIADWRSRLVTEIAAAHEAAEPEVTRLMNAIQVSPGEKIPSISDFDFTAEERAEVLEHQLRGRPFDRLTNPY